MRDVMTQVRQPRTPDSGGIIGTCAMAIMMTVMALGGMPAHAVAQQASLQGVVTSADTRAPIEGVAVILEADGEQARGTRTDRNGFYQIGGIRPGSYTLRASYLGYAEYRESITFAANERRTANLEMTPSAVQVEGLVVAPTGGAAVRDLGRQRITPAEVRRVPVPAGSGDLASYLQTLPGVTTTGDRGGQLFVRGGTSAGNLVLVDGLPVYQPFHILGFFSAFPSDLVSGVDFYAGGFGARYSGRSSSVLDIGIRDGDATDYHATGSVSPFLAEAMAEGPAGSAISWIASARRGLVEETSEGLLGRKQPLSFNDELVKATVTDGADLRCSALGMRTADRGRLDPEANEGYIAWTNTVAGGHCVTQTENVVRLVEVNFGYSGFENTAVSRGSSALHSKIWRLGYDAHATGLIGAFPVYGGLKMYTESMDYDLRELFGTQRQDDDVFGIDGYLEAALPIGPDIEMRPGVVFEASPFVGVEPRLRASWMPFGRSSEKLQGALGLYRQPVVGTSDLRDVSSVFTAWMRAPGDQPLQAVHGILSWQQVLPAGLRYSVAGYYKHLREIPVPAWSAVARFTTRLERADGDVYGADARIEYTRPRFYGFIGYGYARTTYETAQPEFFTWFGDSVQSYNPPHDRRHQVNALANLRVGGFTASVRWQLGTGLPFTRPLGFDDAFDITRDLPEVTTDIGTTRLVVEKPFTGRLPIMHRLDVSLGRDFDLSFGQLTAQVGAINAYDRRNMFYYDLFTGRRVDQLPLAPYISLTLRSR